MKYIFVKITPQRIRDTVMKLSPDTVEVKGKVRVHIDKVNEFNTTYAYVRRIELLSDRHKKFKGEYTQLLYDLSFYRGDFDTEVNGYKVETIIPKVLFDKAKDCGLIFSVRFKSALFEDKPEGVLFWYIHEQVSL